MVRNIKRDTSRPVIGVTGNARRVSPSWICIKLSVWLAGGKALRISTRHKHNINECDGIVISGGDDIHPSLYDHKEPVPKAHYDPERDALEQKYIQFAFDKNVPILGICRGYQLINVTAGGSLYVDIRTMRKKTANHGTILPRKTLKLENNSTISDIFQAKVTRINSLHHQAIKAVASDFRAIAWDLDGFVQSIEHTKGLPILGVQWHPEYLFYLTGHRKLFLWLVKQARKRQQC